MRGSRVRADVAILWDYESFWAQDLEWRPSEDVSHRERIEAFYDRFWRDGLTVDMAHPGQDLSGYRLVVAPASYLLTADDAANLTAYVAGGGTLVTSFFSAVVDEHDAVHPGGFVAPLRDALGLTVEEFLPLREGEQVRVSLDDRVFGTARTEIVADVWADDVALAGAEVVAGYVDGPAAGGPAVTRNAHGAGTGWYVSTRVDVDALATLLAPVYAKAGITPSDTPEGLEVVVRHGDDASYTVAINHLGTRATLGTHGTDLLTNETADGFEVPAGGVRVVRTPNPSH
ncbi:beta-galactosidase [Paraoerskovia sediminicola]|nr:beta-galactosidase trimerization domain-containing protein [Paraoerskovia sediminicola]